MYGTLARYRVKPGMQDKLIEFERDVREAQLPGFIAEFTLRTDEDPHLCYELVIFESKEAYSAVANSPEQDARYHKLLELLEGAPEWYDGEIVHANPALSR